MPPAQDKHSKTEPPTPKRRKEARDRGQVARSPDISAWAATLVGTFALPWYYGIAEERVVGVVAQARNVMGDPTTPGAIAALAAGLRVVLELVLPLGAVCALLAIVTNVAQTGRSVSLKAARPRFDRINPRNGLKRLVGKQMAEQLGKQALKLAVLSVVGFLSIHSLLVEVTGKAPVSLVPILGAAASSILVFVRIIALISLLIGVGDYAFQRRSLMQSLKMTKEEVKDERRSSEGDPAIKGEIRKRMYMIARRQAIAAVRNADVVVTNPSHYAVALQYEPGVGAAPRVIAKGTGSLARAIREKAVDAEVPIVEDPPLARYLYVVCDVDQQIPTEIYVAVAKLLAFVYSLPAMVRTARVHHRAPSQLPPGLAALDRLPAGRQTRAREILVEA